MRFVPVFLFFLIFSTGIAEAGTISLSPVGTTSEQKQINDAIEKTSENGGGTVYLQSGVYIVDNTIKLKSNVNLIGDSDAIIRVSPKTSQFFVGNIGIISSLGPINNITIEGFQIDGNCDELPRSYANSAPKYAHDAERAILIRAYSNKFGSNVVIRNMQIYDCFSDGIHLAFINNALVYDNFISNCQHEGVFFICVTKGELFRNRVAGICSDCLRLDNCVDNRVYDNILFSYDGDNTNGQGKHGENGLQVGDSGVSKGYDARKKPLHTKNIEIFNNTFSNNGLRAIWLDSAGQKPGNNVYVHDNHFIGPKGLETYGEPVNGSINDIEDIFRRPEISREISSPDVFRVLTYGFSFPMREIDLGASATVIFNNISFDPHSLIEVDGNSLKLIKYEYSGKITRYFIDDGIWAGDVDHIGNDLYVPGQFDAGSLKITVYSDKGYQTVTDIKIVERRLVGANSINPNLFIFITTMAILGLSISRNLRRIYP